MIFNFLGIVKMARNKPQDVIDTVFAKVGNPDLPEPDISVDEFMAALRKKYRPELEDKLWP